MASLQQLAARRERHEAGGLQDRQRDRQITRVLRHLGLAGLAFLAEFLEPRDDDGEQLDDDARGDVRHDADREHRQLQQRATGEQVDQRVDTGGVTAGHLIDAGLDVAVVDTRRRQRRAEAIQRDQTEREEDLPPQVRSPEGRHEGGKQRSSWHEMTTTVGTTGPGASNAPVEL